MTSKFLAKYIPEPDLIFGNKKEDKDPRIGLRYHGPYFHQGEDTPLESVRVGIVGNKECTRLVKQIIEDFIKKPRPSPKSNKWLFADYPGMNNESKFKCTLKTSENWNAFISDDLELNKIEKIENANNRIGYAVRLYLKKIESIAQQDDPPNVIICTLPKPVELYCGIGEYTYGAKTARPTQAERRISDLRSKNQSFLTQWGFEPFNKVEIKEKVFDFRNSLKGKIMEYGIPIQIIRESTLNHVINYSDHNEGTEDPATFSWNFSTALYYKANGKPWRLAKLRQDTCYVGISFFVDKLSPNRDIQISLAQVFTHNGEGLVLRGTEVEVDERTKRPYLKKNQARTLMERALKKYRDSSGHNPTRVVVHKSSTFSEDEQAGFNKAIYGQEIPQKDYVAITPSHGWINFIRLGNYPVLRGTLIEIIGNEFLLYSSGFSPRIRSYAGHRIPNALRVTHIGDSQNDEIAKEILGLTKLNWNTTAFSTSFPITITFAKKVGEVLSELEEGNMVQDHYRFFM